MASVVGFRAGWRHRRNSILHLVVRHQFPHRRRRRSPVSLPAPPFKGTRIGVGPPQAGYHLFVRFESQAGHSLSDVCRTPVAELFQRHEKYSRRQRPEWLLVELEASFPMLPCLKFRSFLWAAAAERAAASVLIGPAALVPIGGGTPSFFPCVPLTTCAWVGATNVVAVSTAIASKAVLIVSVSLWWKENTPGTDGFRHLGNFSPGCRDGIAGRSCHCGAGETGYKP